MSESIDYSEQERELEIAEEVVPTPLTTYLRCPMCHQEMPYHLNIHGVTSFNEVISPSVPVILEPAVLPLSPKLEKSVVKRGEFRWRKVMEKSGKMRWVQQPAELEGTAELVPLIERSLLKRLKASDNLQGLAVEDKKAWLQMQCDDRRISFLRECLTLVIDRANILQDSYSQFITTDGFDFHKEIKIFFVGEVAQDAGGLMREWVTEITKVIFTESTGLFKWSRGEHDASYFINPKAKQTYPDFEHLGLLRFAGAILGKAIFEKIPVIPTLARPLLRRLLMTPYEPCLEDLRDYDF